MQPWTWRRGQLKGLVMPGVPWRFCGGMHVGKMTSLFVFCSVVLAEPRSCWSEPSAAWLNRKLVQEVACQRTSYGLVSLLCPQLEASRELGALLRTTYSPRSVSDSTCGRDRNQQESNPDPEILFLGSLQTSSFSCQILVMFPQKCLCLEMVSVISVLKGSCGLR